MDGGATSCHLSFQREDHKPHHLGKSTAGLLPLLGPDLLHHGMPGLATPATLGDCSHHAFLPVEAVDNMELAPEQVDGTLEEAEGVCHGQDQAGPQTLQMVMWEM